MPIELAPHVVELRQYLLRRGRRDELIELFDREFVETQEALGIRVLGQFRDVDRVNNFVWMRGFAGNDARGRALERFYGGPVWGRHGRAANATMIDSSDVHQLRAASEADRLTVETVRDRDSEGERGSIVIVVAHRRFPADVEEGAVSERVRGALEAAGLRVVGCYVTDPSDNPFPALPVRPSNVVVWIAAGKGRGALDAAAHELSQARAALAEEVRRNNRSELLLDILRLLPTARSSLNVRAVGDGAAPESNRASVGLPRLTGFEDPLGHRPPPLREGS